MLNLQKLLQPKIFGLDLSGPIIRVAKTPNQFASGANIREAVRKAKIKTKYVNMGLSETECFIKLIPKDGNIKKEIESNIPLSIREIYYDFEETEQGLFIVAARQKVIDSHIAQIKKAGLIAWAIEPESMAICRSLARNKDSFLIIKISGQESVFIIVSSGIIKFTANDTLEQTSNYLDFYQTHNGQIAKILLCGDGNLQKASKILEKLNLPIEIAQNPAYAAAIGLVLKND